jgi:(p)ppGpp synthase/HD superfamily hydrolase
MSKPLVKQALIDASYYHNGQIDKYQIPVIFHIYDVAILFYERFKHLEYPCYVNSTALNIEHVLCVALLHEVFNKETGCTLEYLSEHYPEIVVDAISVISRKPDETYLDYIKRASTNEMVKHVLTCDLIHNANKAFNGIECDETYETYLDALKIINQ